jgi:NAD(P)-dependent dehydrogenase (short-subunit alcohol dehydrogenase family)
MIESLGHEVVALVQGGSRGVGLAFVEHLLALPSTALVFASSRDPEGASALRALKEREPDRLRLLAIDVTNESTIEAAADEVKQHTERLQLVLNCTGVLHHEGGLSPEKRLLDVKPDHLMESFSVNAFGALLMAKHFSPFVCHGERAVWASLSARVGSIEDNRLGGWYAYRASKAAQNMFTRTIAIELKRRSKQLVCVALHPGTVDTGLSRPFQKRVPPEKLFSPALAASQLLDVINGLTPDDTGCFFAWDGQPIPW